MSKNERSAKNITMKRAISFLCLLVTVFSVLSGCYYQAVYIVECTVEDQELFTYEGLTVSVIGGTYEGSPELHVKNESDQDYRLVICDFITNDEIDSFFWRHYSTDEIDSFFGLHYSTQIEQYYTVCIGDDKPLSECETNLSGVPFVGNVKVGYSEPVCWGKIDYRFAIYRVSEEETAVETKPVDPKDEKEDVDTDTDTDTDDMYYGFDGESVEGGYSTVITYPGVILGGNDGQVSHLKDEDLLHTTDFITVKTSDYDKVDYDALPEEEPVYDKDGIKIWYKLEDYTPKKGLFFSQTTAGTSASATDYLFRAVLISNKSERHVRVEYQFVPVGEQEKEEENEKNLWVDYVDVYAGKKTGWQQSLLFSLGNIGAVDQDGNIVTYRILSDDVTEANLEIRIFDSETGDLLDETVIRNVKIR